MSGEKVLLAELWERTSGRGNLYYSGYLGKASVVLLRSGERDHPTRPGERIIVWRLIVEQRPDQPPAEGALSKRHRLAREISEMHREGEP